MMECLDQDLEKVAEDFSFKQNCWIEATELEDVLVTNSAAGTSGHWQHVLFRNACCCNWNDRTVEGPMLRKQFAC